RRLVGEPETLHRITAAHRDNSDLIQRPAELAPSLIAIDWNELCAIHAVWYHPVASLSATWQYVRHLLTLCCRRSEEEGVSAQDPATREASDTIPQISVLWSQDVRPPIASEYGRSLIETSKQCRLTAVAV